MSALPPGPTKPALLQTLDFAFHPFAFFERNAARYGAPFSMRFAGAPRMVCFSDPAAQKQILSDPSDALIASEASRSHFKAFLGPASLFVLNGAEHTRHRQLLLPPFHGERMRAYGRHIQQAAQRVLGRLPRGSPLPMHPAFQKISLDVIVRAVFGVEEAECAQKLRTAMLATLGGIASKVLYVPALRRGFFGVSPWDRYRRAAAALDALIFAEIENRRGSTGDDILSMLLAARDKQGQALSDSEIHDELLTLLMAGHETTATALTWAVHWLARDREALGRAQDEIRGASDDPESIARLPYLDGVCKESLRLHPVIPALIRTTHAEVDIGGVLLPPGSHPVAAIYLTHHLPELYPEPKRFRPERFIERKYGPYEFLPFGGGDRRCIGQAFAMYEMKLVLRELLGSTSLTAEARIERPVRRNVTLSPAHGGRVTLSAC